MKISNLFTLSGHDPTEDPFREELHDLAANWPLAFMLDLPDGYHAWVAGAYQGKVVQLLAELWPKYESIIGFEPQAWAVENARKRLHGYGAGVRVYDFALGTQDANAVKMGEWGTDACSLINTGANARTWGEATMFDIAAVLRQPEVAADKIDLFVMNMEGYEFDLLPHMRQAKLFDRFERLAIQWHTFPGVGAARDGDAMNAWIAMLESHGYQLRVDQRPAWTFHVKR